MMMPCSADKTHQKPPPQVLCAYGFFALGAGAVWYLVADGAFSAILTMSVMLQCLGIVLLALQVMLSGSARGISMKALGLDALALCCRLSSTVWLNGYLPVDATGDYIFQSFDVLSLIILGWLLHQVWSVRWHTYEADADAFPIMHMICGAFVLAMLLHGNMNGRPIFDALWMAGLFVSTIAVLPQGWLIMHTGGRVEALTSHHIAAMAVSRALSGIFMWHAQGDITCAPWITGFNHAIWAILGAHLLHLILLGDFAYYYVKAVLAGGLNCRMEIDTTDCLV